MFPVHKITQKKKKGTILQNCKKALDCSNGQTKCLQTSMSNANGLKF
jgi:hypothetical protein